ncbi:MAG: hypothetical protein K1X89_31925, partial [Myxococcaceae bacterium]|nr:hypothetical protein [Myxococcaceae bacterium]
VAASLAAGAEGSVPAPRPRWPFLVLTAVGVAASAAAVGLAVSASSDSRAAPQQPYAAQVRALDTSARTKAVGAYVAGGSGAAALTGAAFGLWWSAP